MNKQTKMLLGVGAVGVAAYLIWKSQQPKANAGGYGYQGYKLGDNYYMAGSKPYISPAMAPVYIKNASGSCSSCNKSNASGIGTLTYNQMEDLGASLADIRRRKSQNRQIFK
jgi:hypothetical protein